MARSARNVAQPIAHKGSGAAQGLGCAKSARSTMTGVSSPRGRFDESALGSVARRHGLGRRDRDAGDTCRRSSSPSSSVRIDAADAKLGEIQIPGKGFCNAHRIVRVDPVIRAFGKQCHLPIIHTHDKTLNPSGPPKRQENHNKPSALTKFGSIALTKPLSEKCLLSKTNWSHRYILMGMDFPVRCR